MLTPDGRRRVVLEGGASARYAPTGHIVYARGGQIIAAPFDVRRRAVSGQAAVVVAGASFDPAAGAAFFAFSRNGTLAYVPGGPLVKDRQIGWLDRRGTLTAIPAPRRFYAEPSISPDGRQIALTIRAANDDVWTFDSERGTFSRLTFTHDNNQVPIWSPDGSRIVYASDRHGVRRLMWRPADGGGQEEELTPPE
ncbi:MAG: TolB family protein [Betaproteobacteria bacterium]